MTAAKLTGDWLGYGESAGWCSAANRNETDEPIRAHEPKGARQHSEQMLSCKRPELKNQLESDQNFKVLLREPEGSAPVVVTRGCNDPVDSSNSRSRAD